MGPVDRQLEVVRADPVQVGVGVAEEPPEQHLVGGRTDAGDHVARLEGGLLDLGEVVLRVAVEDHPADLDERVVPVGPHLGEVEGVEPVVGRLLERHHLHESVQPGASPARMASERSWRWASGFAPAMASASSWVR